MCLWNKAVSERPSALLRDNHLAKSEHISTRTAKRPFLTPESATSHISTSFFKLWEGVGVFKEAIQAEKVGKNLISTDKTILYDRATSAQLSETAEGKRETS